MLNNFCKYGEVNDLKIHEKLLFEDSLTVELITFSHKRPYTGGSTAAMAYISLSKSDAHDTISLSVYGVEGKSRDEDGISDDQRYGSPVWHGYKFKLTDFKYDESIKVTVYKNE